MIVSGIAETLPIISIGPLLSIIIENQEGFNIPIIDNLIFNNSLTNFISKELLASLIFIILALISGGLRIITIAFNSLTAAYIGTDFSTELYSLTLYQPYHIHSKRDSSLIISALTTQLNMSVNIIFHTLLIGSSSFLVFFIITTLLFTNFNVNLTSFLVFLSLYLIITKTVNKELKKNSYLVKRSLELQVKTIKVNPQVYMRDSCKRNTHSAIYIYIHA